MMASGRKPINGRSRRSKELEDSMNQELADLGLLEQGMSYEDKEDLLSVVRMSENTAQAEEEDRKAKEISSSATGKPNHTQEPQEDIIGSMAVEKETDKDVILDEFDDETGTQNLSSSTNPSSPLLVMEGVQEFKKTPSSNVKEDEDQGGEEMPEEIDSSNDVSETLHGERENSSPENKTEDNFADQGENAKQDPSLNSGSELNTSKHHKDVKDRNINVFSYNQDCYEKTFTRNKLQIAQERVPFYFVPRGMDIHKYTVYFKCYVDEYFKRLVEIQRNNIEHMKWGSPICMGNSENFSGFKRRRIDGESDSARRYNFRDRFPKRTFIDFASENSEEAEEESNDEDIFTPKGKRLPGIKLSAKRKICSGNDMFSPKKEKKENAVGNKKVQETSVSLSPVNEEHSDPTSDLVNPEISNGGFHSKKVPKSKILSASRKRNRKQAVQSHATIPDEVKTEHIDSIAVTSTTEPEIVAAKENESEVMENIIIKPSPISLKHKKILLQTGANNRPARRKIETSKSIDDNKEAAPQHSDDKIPCPICRSLFPAKDIEEHASDCNQYDMDAPVPMELNKER